MKIHALHLLMVFIGVIIYSLPVNDPITILEIIREAVGATLALQNIAYLIIREVKKQP
jgi:hypothetical protein